MFKFGKESEPTSHQLSGIRVALVATNGFEEAELFEPKKALEDAGAKVDVISFDLGKITGWDVDDWGSSVKVDKTIDEAVAGDYHALMLPGGVINADKLRANQKVVRFVKEFTNAGKPIAAICHALWALIETGAVKNHIVTSWPSLKTDLENSGAKWVDQEVVTDNGWVTSRKPDDIPAFTKKMIEEFCEGRHHVTVNYGDRYHRSGSSVGVG